MTATKELNRTPTALTIAAAAVVIGALYLGKGLLIPLATAILLSFLLSPVCNWLERRGLGRVPSVLLTVVFGFTLLGSLTWTAIGQITSLAPKIPEYRTNIEAKLSSVNSYAVTAIQRLTQSAQSMGEKISSTGVTNEGASTDLGKGGELYAVRVVTDPSSPLEIVAGLSGSFGIALQILGAAAIVNVLVVFFLAQREDLRERFIRLIGKTHVAVTTQTLEDAGSRITKYLSTLFFMNFMFGASISTGLYFIGLPNAILWGMLAGVLRFIPYFGPWIAAIIPIVLSMAISPGWLAPLLTVSLFVALELLNNNLLEPWLYGKNTGVSSVAVLVAAFFWMWLWGPVGLLLATPLTVCLLVVGKHVPELSFLGVLLGSDPVFEPHERVYQKLLAGDIDEALDTVDVQIEKTSLTEVYDTILVPALRLTETHWHLGKLADARYEFIIESFREMIQDHGERNRKPQQLRSDSDSEPMKGETVGQSATKPRWPAVLSLPARSEADEIAAGMLTQVLTLAGNQAYTISLQALEGDLQKLFERHKNIDIICVSAMSPAAVMHARNLCHRLRVQFPDVRLLVGLWDFHNDLPKATSRIGCEAIIVTDLKSAQEVVASMVTPLESTVDVHANTPTSLLLDQVVASVEMLPSLFGVKKC